MSEHLLEIQLSEIFCFHAIQPKKDIPVELEVKSTIQIQLQLPRRRDAFMPTGSHWVERTCVFIYTSGNMHPYIVITLDSSEYANSNPALV